MGWNYTEKTRQLFMDAVHGKPGTHMGEVENPDGLGEHGSISCGDALRFTFRVDKDDADPLNDRIVEARYLTFGCTSAIAASEALCLLIEEKKCNPVEALQITNQNLVDYLGGLPAQKIHCSVMGAEALQAAVYNWAERRGLDPKKIGLEDMTEAEEEGRVVCKCFSVTEPYLRRKIKELDLRTIDEVTAATKAGGACTACHFAPGGIQDLIDEIHGPNAAQAEQTQTEASAAESETGDGMSFYQFCKKMETAVEERVRPALRRDGGDIEIVDIKKDRVYCRLKGACSGCAGAAATLKLTVESALKDEVGDDVRVIAV